MRSEHRPSRMKSGPPCRVDETERQKRRDTTATTTDRVLYIKYLVHSFSAPTGSQGQPCPHLPIRLALLYGLAQYSRHPRVRYV